MDMNEAVACLRSGDVAALEALPDPALEALSRQRDDDGRSCLHTAAAHGHARLCARLAALNAAAVDARDEGGWAPLLSAASAGHADVVSVLVARGAAVSGASPNGRTSLHYAASKGHRGVLQLLLEAGCALLARRTATLCAQPAGSAVDARDARGATPLHGACSSLRLETSRALVEAGARLDAVDEDGSTPLHVAIDAASSRRDAELALFLAARGAPLNAANASRLTPLAAAGENAPLLQAAADGGQAEMDE